MKWNMGMRKERVSLGPTKEEGPVGTQKTPRQLLKAEGTGLELRREGLLHEGDTEAVPITRWRDGRLMGK